MNDTVSLSRSNGTATREGGGFLLQRREVFGGQPRLAAVRTVTGAGRPLQPFVDTLQKDATSSEIAKIKLVVDVKEGNNSPGLR